MSRTAVAVRRSTTLLAIVLAVILGFLAIRAAAAWTAGTAPLEVSPGSITTLQAQVETERARSALLTSELSRLSTQSSELSAALEAARQQIATDSGHAAELSKDLSAAKKKLRSLEKAISEARAALARQPAVTVTTVRTTESSPANSGDEDHEDEDHEEEDEEHDD